MKIRNSNNAPTNTDQWGRTDVSGLLVEYRFDETGGTSATNSAKDRWHGVLNGVSRVDSPNGKAINFPTSDAFVQIDTEKFHVSPDELKFTEQNLTMEVLPARPNRRGGGELSGSGRPWLGRDSSDLARGRQATILDWRQPRCHVEYRIGD